MSRSAVFSLQSFVEKGYEEAIAFHGNLELKFQSYANHLLFVVQKHCGKQNEFEEALRYVNLLHTKDLYLAVACANSSSNAWQRFYTIYQQSIYDTAFYFCRNNTDADQIAGSLPGHLFLCDASDQPRIRSYDGQVSLMSWMRAIIANKVIDQRKLKFNNLERLDSLPDMADETGLQKVEAKVRTGRYGSIIRECFKEVIPQLHKQERLFLSLRYEKEVTLKEIGELLDMSHANVVYHLRKTQRKLRQAITANLENRYHLNEAAIKECKEEILENPTYPLLALVTVD